MIVGGGGCCSISQLNTTGITGYMYCSLESAFSRLKVLRVWPFFITPPRLQPPAEFRVFTSMSRVWIPL